MRKKILETEKERDDLAKAVNSRDSHLLKHKLAQEDFDIKMNMINERRDDA